MRQNTHNARNVASDFAMLPTAMAPLDDHIDIKMWQSHRFLAIDGTREPELYAGRGPHTTHRLNNDETTRNASVESDVAPLKVAVL